MIKIAVEYGTRVARFDVGAQIFNAALIEHIVADRVLSVDIALAFLELFLLGHAFAKFQFVELGL